MIMSNPIKVYGFPRSGNHYLMSLIAENFYQGQDLHTPGGEVGHWANRAIVGAVKYGKLAGHHGPPDWGIDRPSIYVYRDGRAVAASLYNSANFHHPDIDSKNIPFSSFLRIPLSWRWTPGRAASPIGPNVIEHWAQHLEVWEDVPILKLRYEWVVTHPERYLHCIAGVFDLPKMAPGNCPNKTTKPMISQGENAVP